MATLVDLRSEPAVEEISRQIMSEAKLWEAIQEARLELIRQQRQNKAVSLTHKLFFIPRNMVDLYFYFTTYFK